MLDLMLSAPAAPFTAALAIMALIALAEVVGAMFGLGLSGLLDTITPDLDVPDIEFDADAPDPGLDLEAPAVPSPGVFSQFLGWLCVGRVPLLVLLVAFLTAFGIAGLIAQSVVKGVTGLYLPSFLAVIPALAAATPATRYLGLALAQIIPKEETEAVSRQRFVGKVAIITRGVAKRGLPAEAKLHDQHGQAHYILVEPDMDGEEFAQASEVLIVRQTGATFRAIINTNAALSREERSSTHA